MRSILEKAFVALINEENDKAEELFHKFIVERARQIHESNRAGDDFVLEENWNDEITSESYFTEDDLSDLEDDGAEGEGEEGEGDVADADVAEIGDADSATDIEGDDAGADFADDGADMDLDGGAEEGAELEDKIDDLSAQIEKLTAEFEAVMDAIGDEGDFGDADETEASDDVADEFGGADDADFDADASEDEADAVEDDMDGAEEPAMEGEEDDGEFDDITESIIDELEKVTVNLTDGKEVGEGKSFSQEKGAAIPQKSKDARQGGAPIKMKQDAHKGFERETAPPVETLKARRNNVPSAKSALSPKSKEGDKSAEVNKLSSETGNTKSPLEGQ